MEWKLRRRERWTSFQSGSEMSRVRSVEARIRRRRPQIPNCRSSVKERRSHVAWSSAEQELELERLSLEEIGGSMLPDTTGFSSKCTVTIGSCRDEVTSLLSHRGIENKASLQQPSTVAYVVKYCCTKSPQPLAYRECFIVLELSAECVRKKHVIAMCPAAVTSAGDMEGQSPCSPSFI